MSPSWLVSSKLYQHEILTDHNHYSGACLVDYTKSWLHFGDKASKKVLCDRVRKKCVAWKKLTSIAGWSQELPTQFVSYCMRCSHQQCLTVTANTSFMERWRKLRYVPSGMCELDGLYFHCKGYRSRSYHGTPLPWARRPGCWDNSDDGTGWTTRRIEHTSSWYNFQHCWKRSFRF